eukprot:3787064-Amphidinium_carterae.1
MLYVRTVITVSLAQGVTFFFFRAWVGKPFRCEENVAFFPPKKAHKPRNQMLICGCKPLLVMSHTISVAISTVVVVKAI